VPVEKTRSSTYYLLRRRATEGGEDGAKAMVAGALRGDRGGSRRHEPGCRGREPDRAERVRPPLRWAHASVRAQRRRSRRRLAAELDVHVDGRPVGERT